MSMDAPPEMRFLTPEEAMKQKEPDWLIEGLLPAHALSLVYGAADAYKTFTVLDMAASIGMGTLWHGHAVRQGTTAYVVAEGDDAFPKRLQAWVEERGVSLAATRVCQLHQPVYLLEDAMVAALVAGIAELERQAGPVRLVVVDTLSMCMGDGDENLDMGKAAMALNYVRQRTGAHVLAIHHEGHAKKRPRGHSALLGNWPTRIYFSKPEDMACTLTCQKQANSRRFEPVTLRLTERPVTLPSGRQDTSLTVLPDADAATCGIVRPRATRPAIAR
jgi:RecA-family ATPase